jgi:hypothetical protein
MDKKLLFLSFFVFFQLSFAQVGIGTDLPNPSSQLDIESQDRGLLIPRVQLQSIVDANTISAGNVESLMVFNTSQGNDVTPGYYYWYKGQWRRFLVEGEYSAQTITYLADNQDGTFTYTNENNIKFTFDANTTTYVNNNDGTYTFTNANGATMTIDVINDVVTNIQNQGDVYTEIINLLQNNTDTLQDNGDGTFTHTAVDGTQLIFDANTTTYVNNNDGTYTFTNANGATMTIDVINDIVTNIQNQGDVYTEIINLLQNNTDTLQDNGDGTFTHTAVDGTQLIFDANTTTYVNNNDGTYTFTNANGATMTIDVIADVVTNIQNQGDVYTEIINLLQNNTDSLQDNGDGTFTHTAVDGTQLIFDANTTTYVNNNDGTYTFTNANGATMTIDVIADVVTNIQNQGDVYTEIINLLQNNTDTLQDNGDGTFTHTAVDGTQLIFDANTTTYVNNNDGTYTFTNANGATMTIDVINDVVTNIQNQGDVYTEIINLLQNNTDTLQDNGDGTFTHTAVDGTQLIFDANTTTYVNNNDGTYTFTNANGAKMTIDVINDVVTNIQNQGDVYTEIINLLQNNTDTLQDNGDGTFTHTAVDGTQLIFDANTTSVVNNGDGSYSVTNSDGTTININYTADNGISQSANHFQLGGNLIKPTTLGTTGVNTLSITGLEKGDSPTHNIMVLDTNGVLKQVKAAMPRFFYMPAILLPTSSDQVPAGEIYGTVDLYNKYHSQFTGVTNTNFITNAANAGNALPVLPATEFNYYITYYDSSVFYNVSISDSGVLTYDVYPTSAVTEATFMNIVFEVKP